MSISLTPELEQFIQGQVASGKYASTEEVIIAAIKQPTFCDLRFAPNSLAEGISVVCKM